MTLFDRLTPAQQHYMVRLSANCLLRRMRLCDWAGRFVVLMFGLGVTPVNFFLELELNLDSRVLVSSSFSSALSRSVAD